MKTHVKPCAIPHDDHVTLVTVEAIYSIHARA